MLSANIGELERMAKYVSKASSDTEEALLALKSLRSEIMEDAEFNLHPETAAVMEYIESALAILEKNNATLITLKNSTANIAGNYSDNEKKNISALESMKSALTDSASKTKAVMSSSSYPLIDRRSDEAAESRTNELVGTNSEDVEIANISGVASTLKKSFEIKKIEDMEDED